MAMTNPRYHNYGYITCHCPWFSDLPDVNQTFPTFISHSEGQMRGAKFPSSVIELFYCCWHVAPIQSHTGMVVWLYLSTH